MELFLPGIIVILLAAFFVFLILPKMGSTILVVTSVIALLAVAYNHYTMFATEYRLSTWQLMFASNGPWIVLLLAFFFIIASMQHIFSGTTGETSPLEKIGNAVAASIAVTPKANTATNPVTEAVNNAMSLVKSPNNKGSPVIPALGYKSSNA